MSGKQADNKAIPTPRTDAFAQVASADQSTAVIAADWARFARELERELAELHEQVRKIDACRTAAFKHARDAIRTNSRDREDWEDDVFTIMEALTVQPIYVGERQLG